MLLRHYFRKTINGKDISLYTLRHKNGLCCEITNYGAKIVSLWVPDKTGTMTDIVLGFNNINDYLTKEPYFGAVCGRYANRIRNAQFTIEGKTYQLSKNEGEHQIHGGISGFNAKIWDVISLEKTKIVLHYLSSDGEEGYSGNLDVLITYELTDRKELRVLFEAQTDKTTTVNLCQHSYFNLKGTGSIYDHLLQIDSDKITALDADFIPTGELIQVDNLPCDFRQLTKIGDRIFNPYFASANGLDLNWVLNSALINSKEYQLAARLQEPVSGRCMEVYTNQPGIQIYSGNYIENNVGKYGEIYRQHSAICLETQAFPNAPNISHFPSTFLYPGEKYISETFYKLI